MDLYVPFLNRKCTYYRNIYNNKQIYKKLIKNDLWQLQVSNDIDNTAIYNNTVVF